MKLRAVAIRSAGGVLLLLALCVVAAPRQVWARAISIAQASDYWSLPHLCTDGRDGIGGTGAKFAMLRS